MTTKFAQERPDFLPTTEYTEKAPARPDFLPKTEYTQHPNQQVQYVSQSSETFQAVKDMQQAILNFGSTLSAHPVMSMKGLDTGEANGTLTRDRANGNKDYLGGSLPFGNFLVSQYVNNSDIVGKEFVNIDISEPIRSQTAKQNVNLQSVINTINRVGSSGTDHKPDGIWQTRTNNALKQIYAVGSGLLHLANDLGVKISGFTDKNLEDFKNSIPQSYTQLKENKEELAKKLTQYINALTDLYKKFETAVLEHPQYKELIEQNKPIVDHSQDHKTELDKTEQQFLETNRSANIPGAVINGKPVRLADIETSNAFMKFLKEANVDTSSPNAMKTQLENLKQLLGGVEMAGF